jgi:hypothetical protein
MKSKVLFFTLLALSTIVGFFFMICFLSDVRHYHKLSGKTQGIVNQKFISKLGSNAFAPGLYYTYEVKGKIFKGQGRLTRTFLNEHAAREHLLSDQVQSCDIFYDERNPEHSFLHKSLNYNDLFRSLVAWAVSIYFLIKMKSLNKGIIDF